MKPIEGVSKSRWARGGGWGGNWGSVALGASGRV